jgi:hypothetical protein
MAVNPNSQKYTNQRSNFTNSHTKLFGYNKTVDYSARAVKNNILASQDNVNMDLFYTQQITNPNMSWLLRHHGTEQPNLCVRGIMHGQEDFTFQISNDYSTGDESVIGQVLGQVGGHIRDLQKQSTLYNSRAKLTKILGSYADGLADMAKEGFSSNDLMDKIKGVGMGLGSAAAWGGEKLVEGATKFTDMLSKLGVNSDRLMNSHFISAADVVRRYQGSTVQMNLPPLDVFIFHNSNMEAPNVIHMVQAIVQQCLGDLKDAEGIIGLQEAPGGYKAQFDNLNTEVRKVTIPGTWSLTWGGYTINNLIVTNVQVDMSKFNAMDSQGYDTGDPLYARLTLQLDRAAYVSKSDLYRSIIRTSIRYDNQLSASSAELMKTISDDIDVGGASVYEEEVASQTFTDMEAVRKAQEQNRENIANAAKSPDGQDPDDNTAEVVS